MKIYFDKLKLKLDLRQLKVMLQTTKLNWEINKKRKF